MHEPTGDQLFLEAGGTRAVVGTIAAVLRSLEVDGVALTEPVPSGSAPAFGDGIVLAPWPNRVRDGRWLLDGAPQQLDLTEPARGNALHGLLTTADYVVREQGPGHAVLGALIPPQHGWPFLLDSWVRYEVVADGIVVTHGARNLSDRRAPFAVGTHPFLRVGDVPVEELTLTVPAASFVAVDERLNPVGVRPVDAPRDLRSGRRVGDLELDTAFGDVDPAPLPGVEGGASAWLEAPDGRRVTLWQGPDWRWVQVFTTREFPRAEGPGTAVAVEPMTAPPDALNSGDGLVWLDPAQAWEGSWGLTLSA